MWQGDSTGESIRNCPVNTTVRKGGGGAPDTELGFLCSLWKSWRNRYFPAAHEESMREQDPCCSPWRTSLQSSWIHYEGLWPTERSCQSREKSIREKEHSKEEWWGTDHRLHCRGGKNKGMKLSMGERGNKWREGCFHLSLFFTAKVYLNWWSFPLGQTSNCHGQTNKQFPCPHLDSRAFSSHFLPLSSSGGEAREQLDGPLATSQGQLITTW